MSFLSKKPFALDISDFSIKILQLDSGKKIKKIAMIKIEEGIVEDGLIIDKDKLVEKIKQAVLKSKVKTNKVILSLPESRIFTHIFHVPAELQDNALKNAVIEEANKILPLDQTKLYWDYQLINGNSKEKKQSVLYVAVKKEIADSYIRALKRIGLRVKVLTTESVALAVALLKNSDYFSSLKKGIIERRDKMVVDVGARHTKISVFNQKGILKISSVVDVAGNNFTKAIAKELKISSIEAEKEKRNYGFEINKEGERIREILQKQFNDIILEIKKILNYYNDINEILIVGGSAQMPKITEYISSVFRINVNIGVCPVIAQIKENPILYNVVAGLALQASEKKKQDMGINLLPKVKKDIKIKRTGKRKKIPVFIIFLIILFFIFSGLLIYKYGFHEKTLIKDAEDSGTNNEQTIEEPIKEVIEEKKPEVTIQETETGWLNVRKGPGTNYEILLKINPGEKYLFIEESEDWYKIQINDRQFGWISNEYASKSE